MSDDVAPLWNRAGGTPFFDLYGYWPTLHDAVLDTAVYDVAARAIRLTLHYLDRPLNADADLWVRMELVFSGVVRARFALEGNRLIDAPLSEKDGLVRIEFVDGYGTGHIEARGLEAYLVKVDQRPDDDRSVLLVEIV